MKQSWSPYSIRRGHDDGEEADQSGEEEQELHCVRLEISEKIFVFACASLSPELALGVEERGL